MDGDFLQEGRIVVDSFPVKPTDSGYLMKTGYSENSLFVRRMPGAVKMDGYFYSIMERCSGEVPAGEERFLMPCVLSKNENPFYNVKLLAPPGKSGIELLSEGMILPDLEFYQSLGQDYDNPAGFILTSEYCGGTEFFSFPNTCLRNNRGNFDVLFQGEFRAPADEPGRRPVVYVERGVKERTSLSSHNKKMMEIIRKGEKPFWWDMK